MDVLTLLRIIARRWYAVVPGLAVAVMAAYLVRANLDPVYEANGEVLVSAGAAGSDSATGQGEAGSDEDTSPPVTGVVSPVVVAEVLQGGDVRAEVAAAGGNAWYDLEPNAGAGLLRVTAESDDPDDAVETVRLVLDLADATVEDRQDAAGVLDANRVSLEILAIPLEAEDAPADGGGYVASGSALFTGLPAEAGSPYTASTYTAEVLRKAVNSEGRQQQLREDGVEAQYEVTSNHRDQAPVLYITTMATDPDEAVAAFGAVYASLQEELTARHEAAGSGDHPPSHLEALSEPLEAVQIAGDELRPVITVFGLGVLAALSIAVLLDSLYAWRARRRLLGGKGKEERSADPGAVETATEFPRGDRWLTPR